jgi:hypothetical protein
MTFTQTVIISKASNDHEDNKSLASTPRHPKPRLVVSVGNKRDNSRYDLTSPRPTGFLSASVQSAIGDIPSGDPEDASGLPEFVRAAWKSKFLPTLYAYLGSLERPWDLSEGLGGSDDVKVIQMLIDIVYPQSGYKVKLNDRIFAMVCVNCFRIPTVYH